MELSLLKIQFESHQHVNKNIKFMIEKSESPKDSTGTIQSGEAGRGKEPVRVTER